MLRFSIYIYLFQYIIAFIAMCKTTHKAINKKNIQHGGNNNIILL